MPSVHYIPIRFNSFPSPPILSYPCLNGYFPLFSSLPLSSPLIFILLSSVTPLMPLPLKWSMAGSCIFSAPLPMEKNYAETSPLLLGLTSQFFYLSDMGRLCIPGKMQILCLLSFPNFPRQDFSLVFTQKLLKEIPFPDNWELQSWFPLRGGMIPPPPTKSPFTHCFLLIFLPIQGSWILPPPSCPRSSDMPQTLCTKPWLTLLGLHHLASLEQCCQVRCYTMCTSSPFPCGYGVLVIRRVNRETSVWNNEKILKLLIVSPHKYWI